VKAIMQTTSDTELAFLCHRIGRWSFTRWCVKHGIPLERCHLAIFGQLPKRSPWVSLNDLARRGYPTPPSWIDDPAGARKSWNIQEVLCNIEK
jgi:hypothetical protein